MSSDCFCSWVLLTALSCSNSSLCLLHNIYTLTLSNCYKCIPILITAECCEYDVGNIEALSAWRDTQPSSIAGFNRLNPRQSTLARLFSNYSENSQAPYIHYSVHHIKPGQYCVYSSSNESHDHDMYSGAQCHELSSMPRSTHYSHFRGYLPSQNGKW